MVTRAAGGTPSIEVLGVRLDKLLLMLLRRSGPAKPTNIATARRRGHESRVRLRTIKP